ncbi:MAG TPA: T9SS type A sorting domain-containing protein [Caldithrix abyssi]|uniref:T9SS type A sorting domain-containing protein n=1 Tax=Caldithrix abyssi TaxID=187145 RepID=A0A7V4U322_CALAY|nr:T9SS type A sorting domain-containing protein [Caldithrix abyssi]
MKRIGTIISIILFPLLLPAQNIWFNEIHYDNDGADQDEFIEIVLENAGNYTLSDFTITLYNGNGGVTYDTKTLDQYTEGTTQNGFTLYYFNYTNAGGSIQNGSPDGMALSYQGTVIPGQFLSYEGTLTATDGPANGMTSTDIGVSETGTTPIGQSLQLLGSGTQYSDFTWAGPYTATPGLPNTDGGGNDQTLPVELTSFTAKAGDRFVALHWSTASELDNQGYIILRSREEAGAYEEIDSWETNPALRGAGTSTQAHSYEFVDRSVFNDITYWYKLLDVDVNGTRTEHGPIFATPHQTDIPIDPVIGDMPKDYALFQNYPNPFNPSTTIRFDIPQSKEGLVKVSLKIYDLMGRVVKTLAEGELPPGPYALKWNGDDSNGNKLPAGVYFIQLSTPNYKSARKMVLAK